jgi:hypothetical protein
MNSIDSIKQTIKFLKNAYYELYTTALETDTVMEKAPALTETLNEILRLEALVTELQRS